MLLLLLLRYCLIQFHDRKVNKFLFRKLLCLWRDDDSKEVREGGSAVQFLDHQLQVLLFVNKTKLKLKSSTEKGGTKTQTLQNITKPDLI